MALPTPNLDDRRFQDFVDDGKRLVQQRCPEWTDHNVSDPGVTLIETFAMMMDQVMYRLNRVPEVNYLRFLNLIGVRPYPPTAACAELTFWLSAPQPDPVRVPVDTEVAAPRIGNDEPVIFTTQAELVMPPCSLQHTLTISANGEPIDRTDELAAFSTFSATPRSGDALLFGLDRAIPSCAVRLRLECRVEGVGVNPLDPPLEYLAWTGNGWAPCEVDSDTTGGLNKDGEIILHVPRGHMESVLGSRRAGWLMCRVTEPEPGQTFYSASPKLTSANAATVGGTVTGVHARAVRAEMVGRSEGVAGQRFALQHAPVVAGAEPIVVQVSSDAGWIDWQVVETFAYSGPDDRHVMLDSSAGELSFGPAVRTPDGGMRRYGGVPDKGAVIRVPLYRTGGGGAGNVARGMLRVQRNPLPFVASVENRRPASGGVAGESVEQAAIRGPLVLRTRDRAVTGEDYEQLVREAAPELARVRCVPAGADSARILVVPTAAHDEEGRLPFGDLRPAPAVLERVGAYLDERRCLGARVVIEPPYYQGVTVVARLRAFRSADPDDLTQRALRMLFEYFDPLVGGPQREGWPFGRPVQTGEVFGVLQGLRGVDFVDDVRLYGADPRTGERGAAVARLELAPNALTFSYDHQVRVSTP